MSSQCEVQQVSVTCRAAAAIIAVLITRPTGLRVGAAVRTRTAALQELHVGRTRLICENRFISMRTMSEPTFVTTR